MLAHPHGPSDILSQESEALVRETESLGVKPNEWPCPREKVLGGLIVEQFLGPCEDCSADILLGALAARGTQAG